MPGALRQNLFEALIGLLVVLIAVWFVFSAWERTGGGIDDSLEVKALFPSANGVSVGTDVRIAGLKVGTVAAQRLDPESYMAELTLALNEDVKIPSDSSVAITSEGLLGGSFLSVMPGGSDVPLKEGDVIFDTQGSVDMMGLIGSVINRGGGNGGDAGGASQPPAGGLGTMEEPAAQ